MRLSDACRASVLTKKVLDVEFWGTLVEKRSLMAQVVAKSPSFSRQSFIRNSCFEPLLNRHQAAQLLDIHHKTLQKLARRGEIHGSHVGKLWRFRASDLNAWLERQERAS
jgi:excisionase family DNA binding protein